MHIRRYDSESLNSESSTFNNFFVTGTGPMVEIFDRRIEITNPGEPLIDTQRFIDSPPRSRNEALAGMMRRVKICEEAGTGIDKAVEAIESAQLPAIHFTAIQGSTRIFIYGLRRFAELDSKQRIEVCYQHACLCYVQGRRMTNSTLRQRLGIEDKNVAQTSRLIRDALKHRVIKSFDAEAQRKNASYVPIWA